MSTKTDKELIEYLEMRCVELHDENERLKLLLSMKSVKKP